eukprot:1611124-Alexandrium_andersonii.AAC.1
MSASLVGSEMCIRDSLLAYVHDDIYVALPPELSEPGMRAKPNRNLYGACLLYTSDAADDM